MEDSLPVNGRGFPSPLLLKEVGVQKRGELDCCGREGHWNNMRRAFRWQRLWTT